MRLELLDLVIISLNLCIAVTTFRVHLYLRVVLEDTFEEDTVAAMGSSTNFGLQVGFLQTLF